MLLLFCSTASAEVFNCPQAYPGKDRPAAPLTGAMMAWGEDRTGLFAGDYSKPAEGGFDAAYPIMDDQQAWLVCSYGSKKRLKGKLHDGREWYQYMEWGPTEWWIRLPPKVHDCVVHVRESQSRMWRATAECSGKP